MPDPTPDDDQLVRACGVCGSDIKAQPFAPAGMVMGHELGGEIVAVGSRADGWREGINVAVLPVVSCGSCQYCRAGAVSHCPSASYIGMGPAGGFAEYAAVPRATRSPFPPNYPPSTPRSWSRSLSDFTVCSAEVTAGENVLIVGAGGVGLTTLAWASAAGRCPRHGGRPRPAAARDGERAGRYGRARIGLGRRSGSL